MSSRLPEKTFAQAPEKVRLDKWLWAARLFKTRALAKAAIEGGKVQSQGQRLKVAKEISRGMVLQVRQGYDEKTLLVTGLSEQRRGAAEAQALYQETEESLLQRQNQAEQRRLQAVLQQPQGKPDKRARRLRQGMKHQSQ
ncbi:MAG: S4 domain-containing protein [Pseudomonadales bacterium]|nr:S4 domain-containing protein [Pseudomonadales bacterium]